MPDETFAVGDIVEMIAAPDQPWSEHAGKRGVVHWVNADEPDYPNMIVTFDDPALPGVSTRKSHFRKVQ